MSTWEYADQPAQQEINWPAQMRETLAEVSQMNDALWANHWHGGARADGSFAQRIEGSFGQVHFMVARLLNVVTWLVDENAALRATLHEHVKITVLMHSSQSAINADLRDQADAQGRRIRHLYEIIPNPAENDG